MEHIKLDVPAFWSVEVRSHHDGTTLLKAYKAMKLPVDYREVLFEEDNYTYLFWLIGHTPKEELERYSKLREKNEETGLTSRRAGLE